MKSTRLLILIPVLLVLLFFAAWFSLHSFIQSDSFRGWLSKKVGHALHVDGQFEPLTWEGSSFRSAGFSGIGTTKSKLRSIRVVNISAHFDWSQLLKGKWVIDHVSAEKLEAIVGKTTAATPSLPAAPTQQPQTSNLPNFLPSDFRIEQLYVASADLHWETNHGETGQFVGTKLTAHTRGSRSMGCHGHRRKCPARAVPSDASRPCPCRGQPRFDCHPRRQSPDPRRRRNPA